MVCKKCGNEIQIDEKFCGKWGTKVDLKVKKKTNIKPIYSIIGVIVTIIIIISIIFIHNSQSIINEKNINISSNNTTSNKETKQYYDFIDTTYYTFNFTENEIIDRIMNGKSYTSQGFKKMQATIPNRNNYVKVQYPEVQIVGVTTNPSNNKVTSLSLSLQGYYTQDKINSMSETILTNMVIWILNVNSEEQATTEGRSLLSDLINNVSKNKGLVFEYNLEKVSDNINSGTITITVEK